MTSEPPKSISSAEEAHLKPWPKAVALGELIVRELGLADGSDTLGRWMAHRVSELMERAEASEQEVEREAARREATDIILRVWERRAQWPHGYPLEQVSTAMEVMAAAARSFRQKAVPKTGSWFQMAGFLEGFYQREQRICFNAGVAGLPVEKCKEWLEKQGEDLREGERLLFELVVTVSGESFAPDEHPVPGFAALPKRDRDRATIEALKRISLERSALFEQFEETSTDEQPSKQAKDGSSEEVGQS